MERFLRTLLRVLFFPLSLLFVRCSNSSLSSGAVVDPSLLRVNVSFHRSVGYDGEQDDGVEAFIQDAKGNAVANPQIVIKVAGKALALNNGSSNYYGAYPHYQQNDPSWHVATDTTYEVTLGLTDGNEYTLGTIQTQPALTPTRFSPPSKHERKQPLTISWEDLEAHNWLISRWKSWRGETSVTELKISKSNRTIDKWGNILYEGGSPNEADYLTTTVGSEHGTYTIPTTYFQGPLKQFNTLEVLIDSEKQLAIKGPFLEGSAISSSRRGMYRIEVTD